MKKALALLLLVVFISSLALDDIHQEHSKGYGKDKWTGSYGKKEEHSKDSGYGKEYKD